MITWRDKRDKYIINKNGVYLSVTYNELVDLLAVISDILSGENRYYQEDNR